MVEQNLRLEESFAPEVAATLIDLAQLAHHAGSATFEGVGAGANELLGRLLVLCAAQRGQYSWEWMMRLNSSPRLLPRVLKSFVL